MTDDIPAPPMSPEINVNRDGLTITLTDGIRTRVWNASNLMVAKGRETLLKSRPATAAAWLRSVAAPQLPQPVAPTGAQHPHMLGISVSRDEANGSAMDRQESQPSASNSRRAARQRVDRPDRQLTPACGDSALPAARPVTAPETKLKALPATQPSRLQDVHVRVTRRDRTVYASSSEGKISRSVECRNIQNAVDLEAKLIGDHEFAASWVRDGEPKGSELRYHRLERRI